MALPEPLSAAQLKRLEQHRYNASGRSLLEPPLQRYWTWLLESTPLWLAPNAITLGGLVFSVVPTVVLIYYCPRATEEAPPWIFLFCALGLFIYQSLDAIDGKQARRTNSSSPLGELFDHGCDSISTVFVGVAGCIAVRLGTDPDWFFFSSFIGMFLFYCAHWQTYVSGVLKFGKIDVTESEIVIMMVFLLSSFGGTTMWDTKVPVLELQLKKIIVVGVVFGAVFSSYNYFRVIFGGGVGKNGSTIAVAHMTKSEIFLQDTAFIGPGLLFLNQYFNYFIDEYIVLCIALFISLIDLLRYFTGICIQIAAHLHIQVFKLSSQQAPEQVQNHNE
ncbi:cholinephosphotransferase 1 isoform X4 [Candoia aspera]|uniref:cholinephosphotransferase 1 isoform X4 n=1 Tax=Candoia aspera TaxID=51853 RepID=UPI002FD7C864